MDYELAKRLEEAGFKFDSTPIQEIVNGQLVTIDRWKPTLSELIEACGDGFNNLTLLFGGRWVCNYYSDEIGSDFDVEGNTPEEAVALLWLKLNEKETKPL